jgi:acetate kinase
MSEVSNDMRDLRNAIGAGNARARLAVDKFNWTIVKGIGGFFAELGGLDMLVFTGGIGENDIAVRAEICAGLGALGIVLDPILEHLSYFCRALKGSLNQAFASSAVSIGSSSVMA